MDIQVKNFRGVRDVHIEGGPLVLLAGRNKAGKSSFCQAAAAALARKPIPFLKPSEAKGEFSTVIPKPLAGMLVRTGAPGAEATVRNDNGYTTITWPAAEIEATGDGPRASPFAAGIENDNGLWLWFAMDARARARHLVELLRAMPDEATVVQACTALGMSPTSAAKLAKAVTDQGWDSIHAAMREHGVKLKGQWEAATGERFGAKKSGGWTPAKWADDLAEASQSSLAKAMAEAEAALEAAIATNATGAAEREKLQIVAAVAPPPVASLEKRLEALNESLAKCLAKEKTLEPADDRPVDCPHCGKPVAVMAGGPAGHILKKAVKLTEKERARRRKVIEDHRAETRSLAEDLDKVKTDLQRAYQRVDEIAQAKARLEAMGASTAADDTGAVDAAREGVRAARDHIDAFDAWSNAKRISGSIERNQKVIDLLSADGLRKTALASALARFNARLAELCAAAVIRGGTWPTIRLDGEMNVVIADRPLVLSSGSERYMAQAVLQVAMAEIDGSSMVIFDRADVLDPGNRSGIVPLLAHAKLPALVSYTTARPEYLPNLPAATGKCYWIEDGSLAGVMS